MEAINIAKFISNTKIYYSSGKEFLNYKDVINILFIANGLSLAIYNSPLYEDITYLNNDGIRLGSLYEFDLLYKNKSVSNCFDDVCLLEDNKRNLVLNVLKNKYLVDYKTFNIKELNIWKNNIKKNKPDYILNNDMIKEFFLSNMVLYTKNNKKVFNNIYEIFNNDDIEFYNNLNQKHIIIPGDHYKCFLHNDKKYIIITGLINDTLYYYFIDSEFFLVSDINIDNKTFVKIKEKDLSIVDNCIFLKKSILDIVDNNKLDLLIKKFTLSIKGEE